MSHSKKRDIATSFTALIFIVIAITGILMFFHLLDAYTKQLHEIIGLGFVVAVLLHLAFNWKQMKMYFSKKIFLSTAILVSIFSLVFILNSSNRGINPKKVIINKMLSSPIELSLSILGSDIAQANEKLKKVGMEIKEAKSIDELSKQNKKSSFEIISIILN